MALTILIASSVQKFVMKIVVTVTVKIRSTAAPWGLMVIVRVADVIGTNTSTGEKSRQQHTIGMNGKIVMN